MQRAVDSWRNSQQDAGLRSRRMRRLDKNDKRKTIHMNNLQTFVVDTNLLPEHHHHTQKLKQSLDDNAGFPSLWYNGLSHNDHHGVRPDRDL